MRIVGGRFRGRRLASPATRAIRPTTDRLRERLFNMIAHGPYPALAGARVADLFAGTGALGLEALSRGAAHVHFVDRSAAALALIRHTIADLDVADRCTVQRGDARRLPPADAPFDIVFLDPPYGRGLAADALASLDDHGWLRPGSLIVIEQETAGPVTPGPGFTVADRRAQGHSELLLLTTGTCT